MLEFAKRRLEDPRWLAVSLGLEGAHAIQDDVEAKVLNPIELARSPSTVQSSLLHSRENGLELKLSNCTSCTRGENSVGGGEEEELATLGSGKCSIRHSLSSKGTEIQYGEA